MAITPEGRNESYLLQMARKHRMLSWKFVSPARGGVPDRLLITPSGTVFVEVKAPGEKPTRRQLATHAKLRRFGAQVFVVDDRASIDALIVTLSDTDHTPQETS